MATEQDLKTNEPISTLQKMEMLSRTDFFSNVGTQELLLLADQAVETKWEAGEFLYEEGELAADFVCILSGSVTVTRDSRLIRVAQEHDYVGLRELLQQKPRIFSAKAETAVTGLKISGAGFWEILEDYPTLCHAIIAGLATQIDLLTEKLAAV